MSTLCNWLSTYRARPAIRSLLLAKLAMAVRMVVPLALALLFAASDAQLTPAGGKKPHIGTQVRTA